MTERLSAKKLSITCYSENKLQPLVCNVNLSIQSGKTLAIVGESGSGKSLTAMSLIKLLPINQMRIDAEEILYHHSHLADNNYITSTSKICQCSAEAMQKIRGKEIAFIPQDPLLSLNPVHKISKQITEVFKLHRQDLLEKNHLQEAIRLLHKVKIKQPEIVANTYPHTLSGGMRQRVMIAIALAAKPKVLIADEPTTALDITTQKDILILIKQLQVEYQMSLIFISHDLNLVKHLADDIAVMHQGSIVEYNTKYNILNNPQNTYTKKLITANQPKQKSNKSAIINTTNQKNILSVKNVNHHYASTRNLFKKNKPIVPILNDIHFNLFENEILAIVGESGSGKSTLARILTGLEKPTSGSVTYQKQVISALSYKQLMPIKQAIQIVLQDPSAVLQSRFNIDKILKEPLIIHKVGNAQTQTQRINKILYQVGLEPSFRQRFPHQLSGGQKQRIAIARSLILDPKILVLDEPLSALDVILQQQILTLINELKTSLNLSLIIISHDLNLVRHFSDRTLVLNKGKIIELEQTQTLFNNPQHKYTKKLLDSLNFDR